MKPFWRREATGAGDRPDRGGDAAGSRPLARRFTYRYSLALAIAGALAIWSFWTVNQSLDRIEAANRDLEATAGQQARVNQIAALASDLVGTANAGDEPARADLALYRAQIQELEQVQRGLLEGSDALGLRGDPSSEVAALYFGPDTRLADEVRSYADLADRLPGLLDPADEPATRDDVVARLHQAADPVNGRTGVGLERAVDLYTDEVALAIDDQRRANQGMVLLDVIAVLVVVFVIMRPMADSIQIETTNLAEAERIHRENNERQTFHNQLNQALEGTEDEEEILRAVGRAMDEILPDQRGELLLVDDTGAHLRQAQVNARGGPDCPVDSPQACAAIRRGQTVAYETSRALNVCPKLTQHSGGACSAICSPVMFLGRAIGVLHATGPDLAPPDPIDVERLNVLARETGNRLGTLRASVQTELQASTDGLTGLANRRSLEQRAGELINAGRPFTIAMADLDHFKELNDSQGHEAGDRALRLFAHTIRENLRPDDVAARYGGEEFVLLLPDTSVDETRRALDRLRVTLAGAIAAAGSPRFTGSWGVASSAPGARFDEMLGAADEALYQAKRAGRNRVEVGRVGTTRRSVRRTAGRPEDRSPTGDRAAGEPAAFDAAVFDAAIGPLDDELESICASCGSTNPLRSRYCLRCGAVLSADDPHPPSEVG